MKQTGINKSLILDADQLESDGHPRIVYLNSKFILFKYSSFILSTPLRPLYPSSLSYPHALSDRCVHPHPRMSHALDRYINNSLESIDNLDKFDAVTVQQKMELAIGRMSVASLDYYNSISALTCHWEEDKTGGNKDSALFLETLSKLDNTTTHTRSIGDDEKVTTLHQEMIALAKSIQGRRRLFILHYAGHAISAAPSNELVIIPKVDSPRMSMTYLRDGLKHLAEDTDGLDVLIVLDCCCAAIAGRGTVIGGSRVELMAATSPNGISNSREDRPGRTFTEHWCEAFKAHLAVGKPFNCDDIRKTINSDHDLEQFPATYIVREGWGLPITFRASPDTVTKAPPCRTVIAALHIKEDCDSVSLKSLITYLEKAPEGIGIRVLAALPSASTLLLLCVPKVLQALLELPLIGVIVLPRSAGLII